MSSDVASGTRRVAYLDGLRGLAALQVVVGHCMLAFSPASHDGVLRILCDGDFAVFLFFLMSGFVLTSSFERAPLSVGRAALSRVIRLGLPLAAAVILCFVACLIFPEPSATAARLSGSAWLARFTPPDALHAVADASGAGMLLGYHDTGLFQQLVTLPWPLYAAPDPPQWSLHLEFWGSLLLIGLVWCRHVSKFLYAAALAATFVAIGGNALILFVIGNLIAYGLQTRCVAEAVATQPARSAAKGLLVTGLVFAYGDKLPLLWRLDHLHASGLIVTSYPFFSLSREVGATLAFTAIFGLRRIQALLGTRAIAWLGAMSFSIYLLHWGVMLTVGSWLYARVLPSGGTSAIILATAAVVSVTLIAAIPFEHWVDRFAIRASHFGRKSRGLLLPRGSEATLETKPRLAS